LLAREVEAAAAKKAAEEEMIAADLAKEVAARAKKVAEDEIEEAKRATEEALTTKQAAKEEMEAAKKTTEEAATMQVAAQEKADEEILAAYKADKEAIVANATNEVGMIVVARDDGVDFESSRVMAMLDELESKVSEAELRASSLPSSPEADEISAAPQVTEDNNGFKGVEMSYHDLMDQSMLSEPFSPSSTLSPSRISDESGESEERAVEKDEEMKKEKEEEEEEEENELGSETESEPGAGSVVDSSESVSSSSDDDDDDLTSMMVLVVESISKMQSGELQGEDLENAIAEAYHVVELLREDDRIEEAGELEPIVIQLDGAARISSATKKLEEAEGYDVGATREAYIEMKAQAGLWRETKGEAGQEIEEALSGVVTQVLLLGDRKGSRVAEMSIGELSALDRVGIKKMICELDCYLKWVREGGDEEKAIDLERALGSIAAVEAGVLARELRGALNDAGGKAESVQSDHVTELIQQVLPIVVQLQVDGREAEARSMDLAMEGALHAGTSEKRVALIGELVVRMGDFVAFKLREGRLIRQMEARSMSHGLAVSRTSARGRASRLLQGSHNSSSTATTPVTKGQLCGTCEGCQIDLMASRLLEEVAEMRRLDYTTTLTELMAFHGRKRLFEQTEAWNR